MIPEIPTEIARMIAQHPNLLASIVRAATSGFSDAQMAKAIDDLLVVVSDEIMIRKLRERETG